MAAGGELQRLAAAAAYRPQRLVLAAIEGRALVHWTERIEAAVLFADISGFTKLSEQLAKLGTRGAEEMTAALNRTFEAAIAAVHGWGGEVLAFGGDALTALFAARSGPHLPEAAQQARECAAAIHRAVDALGETAGVRLRVACGIGAGEVVLLGVDGGGEEAELLAAGPALHLAAEARGLASAGETFEDPSSAELPRPPAYPVRAPPPVPRVLAEAAAKGAFRALEPFLFTAVRERLRLGAAASVGEHRRIVCLFVNVRGLDPLERGEEARAFLGRLLRAVSRHGGMVNKFESADKGLLLMALFGAQTGHENDEERACALALHLLDEAKTARADGIQVELRAGINGGAAFAGDVGANVRKEFTVIGDTVNLAARLMSNAGWGGVLLGGAPTQRVQQRFRLARKDDLHVKGRAEPAQVHELVGEAPRVASRPSRGTSGRLVGRVDELAAIDAALAGAGAGRGGALWLAGEAGTGKSRLAREAAARAQAAGFEVLEAECAFDGAETPWLPLRAIVRALLQLPPVVTAAEASTRLRETLVEAGEPEARALEVLLGLPSPGGVVPPAPKVAAIFQRLVERACARKAHLFVLDDLQWIDFLSRVALGALAQQALAQRLLLFGAGRPPLTPPGPGARLGLGPLGPEEARALARLRLAGLATEARVEVVATRAAGNPFFVEELSRALVDAGLRGVGAADELPATVQAVVQARLDRLDPLDREVLRAAAAFGRTVSEALLAEVAPPGCTGARLQQALEALDGAELLEPAGPGTRAFPQGLLREVAYEGMPFARRRQLHRDIGAALERRLGENAAQEAEVLAHHFGLGEDERELPYAELAAQRARRLGRHEAAVRLWRRVVSAAPAQQGERRSRALAHLAETLADLGRHDEAIEAARRLESLAGGDAARAVEAATLAARALAFRGQLSRAREEAERAVAQAHAISAPLLAARARQVIAYVEWGTGDFRAADLTLRGVAAIARSTGDRAWLVRVLHHLAFAAHQRAQPAEEDRLLEEVRILSEGFGTRQERIRALTLRTLVAVRRLELALAAEVDRALREEAAASDEPFLTGGARRLDGLLARAEGRLADGALALRAAAELYRGCEARYDEAEARALTAELEAERGALAAALEEAEAATQRAGGHGDRLALSRAAFARAMVAWRCGLVEEAAREADGAAAIAAPLGLAAVELPARMLAAAAKGDVGALRTARDEAGRRRLAREAAVGFVLEAEALLRGGNSFGAQSAATEAGRRTKDPSLQARAQLCGARAMRAEGRLFEAAPSFEQAARALAGCGDLLEAGLAAIEAAGASGADVTALRAALEVEAARLTAPLAAGLRARFA